MGFFLLSNKNNAFSLLEAFITYVSTQFQEKVQIVRSDNGSEFGDQYTLAFYKRQGIIHQTTCVDTS